METSGSHVTDFTVLSTWRPHGPPCWSETLSFSTEKVEDMNCEHTSEFQGVVPVTICAEIRLFPSNVDNGLRVVLSPLWTVRCLFSAQDSCSRRSTRKVHLNDTFFKNTLTGLFKRSFSLNYSRWIYSWQVIRIFSRKVLFKSFYKPLLFYRFSNKEGRQGKNITCVVCPFKKRNRDKILLVCSLIRCWAQFFNSIYSILFFPLCFR